MDNLDDIFTDEGKELLQELQEKQQEKTENQEDDYEPTDKPFVEVPSEDARTVVDSYQRLRQLQMDLGSLLINFETQKDDLLSDFREAEENMQQSLKELERTYNIPHGDKYTFNMPSSGDEQGLFYRNDLSEEEREEVEDRIDDTEGDIERATVDTSDD